MSEHVHEWEEGRTRSGAYRRRCKVRGCRYHAWRSRLNVVGRRGKRLRPVDRKVGAAVKARDRFCMAAWLLTGERIQADDTHHIAKKLTHRGVDVRGNAGYAVRLSRLWHDRTETGDTKDRLYTTAEPMEGGRVLWIFEWRGRRALHVVNDQPTEV